MVGIILSVVGIAFSIGIFYYQENQADSERESAWRGIKNLFFSLSSSPAASGQIINNGYDNTWGRYRFVVILSSDRVAYVDLHPGNFSIWFTQLDRDGGGRFSISLYEQRSPSDVRATLLRGGLVAQRDRGSDYYELG